MTTRRPFPFLLAGLGIALVCYHTKNFQTNEWFSPTKGWDWAPLRLVVSGKRWLDTVVPVRRRSTFAAADGASLAIRETGHRWHYESGRLPDFLFAGERTPLLHLYARNEIPVQFNGTGNAAFAEEVRRFEKELADAGVHFLVVPVPTKVSIERDRLPRELPAANPWNRVPRGPERDGLAYREVVAWAPSSTVDLDRAFREYRKLSPKNPLYAPGATHWSTLGMAVAASSVVNALRQRGVVARAPTIAYENKLVPEYGHDLLRTMLLPPSFLATAPELQWFESVYDVTPVANAPDRKIVVAGSCHTRRHMDGYGFGTILQRALGSLYVDSSLDFASTTEPLWQLAKDEVALLPGDILLWEFSVRNPPPPGARLPQLKLAAVPGRTVTSKGKGNR